MCPPDLVDRVSSVVQDVAASVIEPRFATLTAADVEVKPSGGLVTIADREAEALLTEHLQAILPGAPVIGEEACSIDPSRLRGIDAERAWVVDPLDGTANFAAGSPDWAVMVALLAHGATVAAWIWQPAARAFYVAERGAGAARNGDRLSPLHRPEDAGLLRGVVHRRFLDPATAMSVERNVGRFAEVREGRRCSGVEYPALVEGASDFLLFWRTLPWDHAPGALLVEEAGGVARRPDGSDYRPGTVDVGLLVAPDARTWQQAAGILG